MPRHINQIAADFDALTPGDFEYAHAKANGWERLLLLCDEMRELNDAPACAPVMFRTMERLDDVELGNARPPGSYAGVLARRVRTVPY
jgi:hypothetical protein